MATDIVEAVLQENDLDFDLSISTSTDSGETLFGKSYSKSVTFDAKYSDANPGVVASSEKKIINPFVTIKYAWKGGVDLGLSSKKIRKEINKVNSIFSSEIGHELFDIDKFNRVDRLQLYRIGVNFSVYPEGVDHFLSLTEEEFEDIFAKHYKYKNMHNNRNSSEGLGPIKGWVNSCLLYTSPSPRDKRQSRMPSSA